MRLRLVAPTCAVLAWGIALSAVPAAQAATVRRAAVGTHYATIVRDCPPARVGHASCFVLQRKAASASTANARPYVVSASYPVGPAAGYTPSDLWSAYDLGSLATLTASGAPGNGQTVGIVDAYDDPNIESDLQTFDSEYGLPTCTTANGCFSKVSQTGSSTALPAAAGTVSGSAGWDQEISLDVETVHAVCPDCKVLLVEANSSSDSDLGAAVNEAVTLGANEVSNSYGGPEGTSATADSTFESAFNHPGVVLTASAGDQGYYNWAYRAQGATTYPAQANVPAALPDAVAIGGTQLELNSDGSRASESVWNDGVTDIEAGVGGAGGGGCSKLFAAPSWQSAEAGYSAAACGGDRLVSDISADADPYTGFDTYDSYSNGCGSSNSWCTSGGTSLSSPIIAAIYALAGGAHGVSEPAQTLYNQPGGTFYDVTGGGNGYCDGDYTSCPVTAGQDDCGSATDGACNAEPGFDGPTGLGTPAGIDGFAPAGSTDPTSTSVDCSPTSGQAGEPTTCTATVTDTASGGATTPTGTVSFTATTPGSFTGDAECTLAAGSTTGSATCQDSFTPSGGSASYTVTGTYSSDPTHSASHGTSSSLTATAPDTTQTAVSCSPSSITLGNSTACTATVTDEVSTGATNPTGTVTFAVASGSGSFTGGVNTCSLEPSATTGVASCQVTFQPDQSGLAQITGTYGGDATHSGSEGTSESLTASAPIDPTATSLICAPSSVTTAASTICTATVADTAASNPSTPSGTVSFASSAPGTFGSGGTCTLAPTSVRGVASCQDGFRPASAGAATVTAAYHGDGGHDTSTGHAEIDAIAPTAVASLGHPTVSGTTASVPVRCTGGASCRVKLTVSVVETLKHGTVVAVSATARTTHKTVDLVSRSVTVPAGATQTVTLKLDSAARRLLKKHSPMKALLTLATASGSSVEHTTLRFTRAHS
jgi:hypothetical protein